MHLSDIKCIIDIKKFKNSRNVSLRTILRKPAFQNELAGFCNTQLIKSNIMVK